MSYPRGADVGIAGGPGGSSIGSASLVATLATYVTSGSLATALTPYLTSASAALSTYVTSGSLNTALTPYLTSASAAGVYITSNSVSIMIGDRPTSNSVSTQITSRLSTYLTSGSLITALGPYLTSASAALSTYVTSGSLATALGPYLTSASAALSTYVTSNSFSAFRASLTLDSLVDVSLSAVSDGQVLKWNAVAGQWLNAADLTGGGGGSDTFTACVVAATSIMTVQGKEVGLVLLGSISFNARNGNTTPISFSGSWSDIAILDLIVNFGSAAVSNTASVAAYTDGGTTPIFSLTVGTVSGAQNYVVARIFNGTAHKSINIQGTVVGTTVKNGITNTANTGVLNCVKLFMGALSPTLSAGQAYLYGWRGRI